MMKSKKPQINKILSWVAVLLWMGIIFAFSAQPAEQSAGLSARLTENIISIISEFIPLDIDVFITPEKIEQFHHIIRKVAHGLVYFGLGVLMINAFKKSGFKGYRAYGLALLICVLYAISDEIHQVYIPGRAGQIMDVLIDSGGSFLGISGYSIVGRIFRR